MNSQLQTVKDWSRRLFKNSYTRKGRLIRVAAWSVKIQHHGIRRTFSLQNREKMAAALEARALHALIIKKGLRHAAERYVPCPAPAGGGLQENHSADLRAWKRRLLLPKHAIQDGYVTRIEHEGLSHYFPLGTLDPSEAARQAREIHRYILKRGWGAANQAFSRELTIAIHWAADPVAWTYATFHTTPNREEHRSRTIAKQSGRRTLGIAEPDAGIRNGIAGCIDRQPGFYCNTTFDNARTCLNSLSRNIPDALLVGEGFPEMTNEWLDAVRKAAPEMPVLIYSIHEDSDQLFKSTPGGATGYILKRTPPEKILDPLNQAQKQQKLTPPLVLSLAQRYFQNITASLVVTEAAPELARLTHREHDVLNLLSKGFLDKEIAAALRISTWTVHGHLKRIFEKLNVHTRTEAVVKYFHK
jgi:DNA-binding NarL/FixJ family response regulator